MAGQKGVRQEGAVAKAYAAQGRLTKGYMAILKYLNLILREMESHWMVLVRGLSLLSL